MSVMTTEWFIKGFRIILSPTRGGGKMVVVRSVGTNKYLFHLENTDNLDEWLKWLASDPKEYLNGKAESEKEDRS
jgi:hypothetical protein